VPILKSENSTRKVKNKEEKIHQKNKYKKPNKLDLGKKKNVKTQKIP